MIENLNANFKKIYQTNNTYHVNHQDLGLCNAIVLKLNIDCGKVKKPSRIACYTRLCIRFEYGSRCVFELNQLIKLSPSLKHTLLKHFAGNLLRNKRHALTRRDDSIRLAFKFTIYGLRHSVLFIVTRFLMTKKSYFIIAFSALLY